VLVERLGGGPAGGSPAGAGSTPATPPAAAVLLLGGWGRRPQGDAPRRAGPSEPNLPTSTRSHRYRLDFVEVFHGPASSGWMSRPALYALAPPSVTHTETRYESVPKGCPWPVNHATRVVTTVSRAWSRRVAPLAPERSDDSLWNRLYDVPGSRPHRNGAAGRRSARRFRERSGKSASSKGQSTIAPGPQPGMRPNWI
jgi:hypothetical protein